MNETTARDHRLAIAALEPLDDQYVRMTVEAPPRLAGFAPGQFAMIKCGEPTLLRRPLSIQRAVQRASGACIELLFRVVGRGTRLLSEMRPGDEIDVLGPLGQPFDLPGEGEVGLLLGGGVGIPPMVALGLAIEADGGTPRVFAGVTSARDRACFTGLEALASGAVRATMDGSEGHHGTVLDALEASWGGAGPPAGARVYACGPVVMLKAVAARCTELGLPCQVSVETLMGCGIGVCVGCAAPLRNGRGVVHYALACQDGPVFDATEVNLDALEGTV